MVYHALDGIMFEPQELADMVKIGMYHFEAGFCEFSGWSKQMIADVGESARPGLNMIWAEVSKTRTVPGVSNDAPLSKLLDRERIHHEGSSENHSVSSAGHAVSQIRPWMRYWARMFDLCLFSFIAGIALAFLAPIILLAPSVVVTFFIMQTWVFQESILLSTLGTTPGKWLFAIKLRDADGKKLKLPNALGRSFSVWLKGCGLGIPIIALFTQLGARSTLKKTGSTSWDKAGGFLVTHSRIGVIRSTVAVLFFAGFFLLSVAENVVEDQTIAASSYELSPSKEDSVHELIPLGDISPLGTDYQYQLKQEPGRQRPAAHTGEKPNLAVKGIVYSDTNPSALIGGEVVHEGDTISGAQVVKITRDAVELEMNGTTWRQIIGLENQEK